MSNVHHPRLQAVAEEDRVTQIELFFDLVFVFAITQVTALMADDLTARGVLRGLLVLSLLWWCWVGYAWLGNVVRADEGLGRVTMFAGMAAMFVMALSVPEAFVDNPEGGLSGPVVFAFAYLAVRLLHLTIFWLAAGSNLDSGLQGQLIRFAPSVLGSTALLLVASQLEGRAQTVTWVAVIVVDLGGTLLAGASGWRLNSAAHFAERHGLIIIIALGESIVAIGQGVAQGADLMARDRRVRPGADSGGLPVVGLLRRDLVDRRAGVASRTGRGAHAAGARRLQLLAPADDRRHRPARARPEEGAGVRQ